MNVRLTTDEIRFRITARELVALQAGQMLSEVIGFADEAFAISLTPAVLGDPTALEAGPWRLHLSVAENDIRALVDAGATKSGVEHRFGTVRVALEVDIRTRP